ncbi:hypothetical protein ACQPW1_13550 [Nocardia sp. CA-128927]|uniref:hypothetical protein n=1 Tax=Nocardia sp. CA-128927 TaxID=3239975 RepID=UPI003D9634D6
MKQDVSVPVRTSTGSMTALEFQARTGRGAVPGYLALELSRPLPDVCCRHGRPAVERRPGVVRFHQGTHGRVQSTWATSFFWGLRHYRRMPEGNTELHGDWPVCKRCLWQTLVFRLIGYVFALLGIIAAVALWMAAQAGIIKEIPMLVVLIFFPGWLPCGLVVAASAFGRATRYVRIRPIVDRATVVIRAHPNFAAAVAAQSEVT